MGNTGKTQMKKKPIYLQKLQYELQESGISKRPQKEN